MQLLLGCSITHHTPLAEARMSSRKARAASVFPSLTAWESERPRGRLRDLHVEPRLLSTQLDITGLCMGTYFSYLQIVIGTLSQALLSLKYNYICQVNH